MRTRSFSGTDCAAAAAATTSIHGSLISSLPFHDDLAQPQVSGATQGLGDAFGLPQRAGPPAMGVTAGGETRGPLWPHTALHHVTAEHAAAVQHLHPRRGLGGKQGLDARRGGRFPHLARIVPTGHGSYFHGVADRKSTRLNSSHLGISYA